MPLGLSRQELHTIASQPFDQQAVPTITGKLGELELRGAWVDAYDGRGSKLFMILRNRISQKAIWIPFENAWLFAEKNAHDSDMIAEYAATLFGHTWSKLDGYKILDLVLGWLPEFKNALPARIKTNAEIIDDMVRLDGLESMKVNGKDLM